MIYCEYDVYCIALCSFTFFSWFIYTVNKSVQLVYLYVYVHILTCLKCLKPMSCGWRPERLCKLQTIVDTFSCRKRQVINSPMTNQFTYDET